MADPIVISVNISVGGIPKSPVERAIVTSAGLAGDRHNHEKHNTSLQAISILDEEDIDDLQREGFKVFPGATGENLTVRGLSIDGMQAGQRLRFEGGVEIELTKRRQPCYVLDAIDPELKRAIVGRCGFLARVMRGGEIRAGERIVAREVERPPSAIACTPAIAATAKEVGVVGGEAAERRG